MTPENIELVRRWFAGLNHGELRLELVSDEVRIDNVEGTLGGPYFGHEGMRQWWEDVWSAFAGLRLEVEEIIDVDDERVVVVHRFLGRYRSTGIPLDHQWASIQTVRDGRLVAAQGYASRRHALEAAGVSR